MRFTVTVLSLMLAGCGGENTPPKAKEAGQARDATTKALETGAALLQDITPVKQISVYLVGLHPMKDDPKKQMMAHHYCNQVNEDLAQCVLFDGNTKDAHLNGIEYIISERLFETLPAAEKEYWHPHNYEILSGQLVPPGLPDTAEKELMRKKMNSYGKTWHVWMSDHGDKLPFGDPHLAWSFNADGQANEPLMVERNRRFANSADRRVQRADLTALAKPQEGVDALSGAFPNAKARPEGVRGK